MRGNEIEKIYIMYELRLDVMRPFNTFSLDKLAKKLNENPDALKYAVNKKTNVVKVYTPHQFLNSPFGKPIKTVLIIIYE